MTEQKREFIDKGVSPTGVYIVDPTQYSLWVLTAETLPIPLKKGEGYVYRGNWINPNDPYAFHTEFEVDKAIKDSVTAVMEQGLEATIKHDEEQAKFLMENKKFLEAKYGVTYELPDEDTFELLYPTGKLANEEE